MHRCIPLLFVLACAADKADNEGPVCDIDAGPLAGVIDGQDWRFVVGDTDSFLSDDESFFVGLYGEERDACRNEPPQEPFVIASLPAEPGDYDFGGGRNGTFVVPTEEGSENSPSFVGRFLIDSVTETEVSGGLCMRFGDENEVSGRFDAVVCADD